MRTHRRAVAVALAVLSSGLARAAGDEGRPRVEFGLEERVRSEAWNEILDQDETLEDQRIQYRFRTRLWLRGELRGGWEFAAGLDNESRNVVRPDSEFKWDEVVFETLYAGWRSGRFSARIGRQNLMRGDGFVLWDASALDGSRTAYFNAALFALTWPGATRPAAAVEGTIPARTTLELMAISNPSSDQYLPRFNDRERPLTEWDEAALALYATHRPSERTTLEGYWFYKTETDDVRPATHPLFQPDRRLHTLGARAVRRVGGGWSATAELALQRGSQDPRPGESGDADIRAWGGQAQVRRTFGGRMRPSLALGYVGLSGDDPGTPDAEGWDPLFARWPKWSDLYIYTLAPERGPSYWSNLRMWQVEGRLVPVEPLALRASWYHMDADEPHPGALYGGGTRRGDLLEFRADLALGRDLKAHALYEHLDPGDFYAGTDAGYFVRFEVLYTLRVPAPPPAAPAGGSRR